MEKDINISQEILDQTLNVNSLMEYINALDPQRHVLTDPVDLEMLLPLLKHCGYTTIHDLHQKVKTGWERFCRYEKDHRFQDTLSGSMAILYAIIIADELCRKTIGIADDYEELATYIK